MGLVTMLLVGLAVIIAFLTIYGSYLISNESTRKRGWRIIAGSVSLLLVREGWSAYVK